MEELGMGAQFDLGAMEMTDLESPLPQSCTGSLRRSGFLPPPHRSAACAAPPCGAAGPSLMRYWKATPQLLETNLERLLELAEQEGP